MTKHKGIIQVAQEELARANDKADTNYTTANNLRKKANQLRENSPNDFKSMKEAKELIEEAKHYQSIAENVTSIDVFVAKRSLDEEKERVRKFKLYVDGLKGDLVTVKHGLEELKFKHQQELERQGRDIQIVSERLEQAQQELDQLEGN